MARRPLDALMDLYRLRPGEVLPQLVAMPDQSMDMYGPLSSGDSGSFMYQDRRVRYFDYEAMDLQGSYPHRSLDVFADEATSPDPTTDQVLTVNSKSKKIREACEDLGRQLKLESIINALCRSVAKYGDMWACPTVHGSHGIVELMWVPPHTTEIISHPQSGKFSGYRSTALRSAGGPASDPSLTASSALSSNPGAAANLAPWDLVHFRRAGSDLTSLYGLSMLEAARQSWRELNMLETAVVIYRVHKTGQKFVYYVDVGKSTPDEARRITEQWMRTLTKKRVISLSDSDREQAPGFGQYIERYKPFAMNDDVYWPIREGVNSHVDSFAVSGDITAVEDVQHFLGKVRMSFGIPKAFYDGDISGWGANKALAQQDIQFARQILKLQGAVVDGLTQLYTFHLIHRGLIDSFDPEIFEVKMFSPSYLLALQQIELMTSRSSLAVELMGMSDTFGFYPDRWRRFVLRSAMGMTEGQIKHFVDPEAPIAPIQTAPLSAGPEDDEDLFSDSASEAREEETTGVRYLPERRSPRPHLSRYRRNR